MPIYGRTDQSTVQQINNDEKKNRAISPVIAVSKRARWCGQVKRRFATSIQSYWSCAVAQAAIEHVRNDVECLGWFLEWTTVALELE